MDIQWDVGIWGQLFTVTLERRLRQPDSLTVKTRPGHKMLGGQIGSYLAHLLLCSGPSPRRLPLTVVKFLWMRRG